MYMTSRGGKEHLLIRPIILFPWVRRVGPQLLQYSSQQKIQHTSQPDTFKYYLVAGSHSDAARAPVSVYGSIQGKPQLTACSKELESDLIAVGMSNAFIEQSDDHIHHPT